ncbi:NAD-dependent epimerase/dehydratase family protein [Enterococcus pallens]|uniref:NAD-dependent epimerase/dehydratase domain-containing protein n=1 Tax=Enterococcus pallens ATCC BAA-351 TaxID=1158607 RepID=R2SJM8_9ENTE|nr:NAD-dependent epimerase/dehydratase family protein [Enterococcus pallens]EOH93066.1 hypothetical protein UAU_02708 [Enterococcus pallens ATCC BAA-351]EOU24852.1 hypothetical protein I588_00839 [Enterococcus pallens ATCC BAA-351]OJG76134.1 hypothetical protein RV10_GL004195 [Enterococcus pallens]
MKIVVIGGAGHIGTYLTPRLAKAGHEVISISRGINKPYIEDPAWEKVKQMKLDRSKTEDFSQKIADLNADVVVDLINFTLKDVKSMVEALRETNLSHYLYCSSIWAHGRAELVPADPNGVKHPLDEYGCQKYQSEQYLKKEFRTTGFPATVIMPGQISGPGWTFINPLGNEDSKVFQTIAEGGKIYLPNFGMETLHHVHASDVAQMFVDAVNHRNQAVGESFHAVAEESLTLYGYATLMYQFFNRDPKIEFLSWEKWCEYIDDEYHIDKTYYHIARSGYYSIENAKNLIGYSPKYKTSDVVEDSLKSYIERGIISVPQ